MLASNHKGSAAPCGGARFLNRGRIDLLQSLLRRLILFMFAVALLGAAFAATTLLPASHPLAFARAAHAQDDQSLVWELFDVDITVNSDGTIRVCEEQAILSLIHI